jgi:hypothetical protein
MKIYVFVFLMLISIGSFAQKHVLGSEISFSTLSLAANYEGFVSSHFSLGAKLGLFTIGAEANYYFDNFNFDQWNGHVGLGYELTGAWPVLSGIYGPTLTVGVEHISASGFLIGLDGGIMSATYFDEYSSGNQIYPLINLKIAKVLKSKF